MFWKYNWWSFPLKIKSNSWFLGVLAHFLCAECWALAFLQSLTPAAMNWAIEQADPLASDFFALNSKNPFCLSPADIWQHDNAFCSSAKVSRGLSFPLLPGLPFLSFLLSHHSLPGQPPPYSIKTIQTVNSMVKNPSLDLTVHGINSPIKSSWKS